MRKQIWIKNAKYDLIWILSVPFVCLLLFVVFNNYFVTHSEVDLVFWFVLVLGIDVTHVYSTLYRSYFDEHIYGKLKLKLIAIPIGVFVTGVLLYGTSSFLFWRIMAYLAVFHFVKQQYGFMKLYSRAEKESVFLKWIDQFAIYSATLFPMLYWHINDDKNIQWFLKDEFFKLDDFGYSNYLFAVYICILLAYLAKCVYLYLKDSYFNLPKFLVLLGTALSWYIGIVLYDNDLIYTFFNVVCHGVPYIALVIAGLKPNRSRLKTKWVKYGYHWIGVLVFIFVCAFVEELFWNQLVWREHLKLFFGDVLDLQLNKNELLSLLVPLLAVPQVTHYILDGFIWKRHIENV